MATQHIHGRGGAGNAHSGPKEPVDTKDLATPTIKQQTYTTGRGGSGNMASNDNPESARKAQDVEDKVVQSDREKKGGTYHWGRGGEGNMTTIKDDSKIKEGSKNVEKDKDKEKDKEKERPKLEKRKSTNRGSGTKERTGSWLEKGKEKLGLKGQKAEEGSAIED